MEQFQRSINYSLVLLAIGILFAVPDHSHLFGLQSVEAEREIELVGITKNIIDLNDPEIDRSICVFAEFTDFDLSDGRFIMKIIDQKTGKVTYDSKIIVGSTKTTPTANFKSAVGYIVTENMIDKKQVVGGSYVIEISTLDGVVSKRMPFTIKPFPSNGGGSSFSSPAIGKVTFATLGNPENGFGGIIQNLDLNSISTTQILNTGDDALIRVELNDPDGINDIDHVTIYLNYRGTGPLIPFNSIDTFITYKKGQPLIINDPNDLINTAEINILKIDTSNFALNLEINFEKPMDTSNIAVRSWDLARNVVATEFVDAIKVINPEINSIKGVTKPSISNWIDTSFDWWSQGLITDSEFFNTIEFLTINGIVQTDFNTIISNLIENSR